MGREVDTWSDTEEWTRSVGQRSRYLVRQGGNGHGQLGREVDYLVRHGGMDTGQLDRKVDTWSDTEEWIRSVGQGIIYLVRDGGMDNGQRSRYLVRQGEMDMVSWAGK